MPKEIQEREPGNARSARRKWFFFALWQSGAILVMAAMIGWTFNQIRSDRLPWVADWSPRGQLTLKDTGESLSISIEEAETLFFTQGAIFIDARSQEVFNQGHIQGARNLPWDDFETSFSRVMADIDSGSLIITYCDGESCSLSKELAFALVEKGYGNVRVLLGGWPLWQQSNLPVE